MSLNWHKGDRDPNLPIIFLRHSQQVEKISGGGSDMILPFNFKKIAPPRPEENQIRHP